MVLLFFIFKEVQIQRNYVIDSCTSYVIINFTLKHGNFPKYFLPTRRKYQILEREMENVRTKREQDVEKEEKGNNKWLDI